MSELQGKNIIQQGLVLHLDSGNPQSFDGNSTIWRDLSGYGNNGTLVNGVGYSGLNKGTMVFDGVDDYVDCGDIIRGKTTITLSVWIKTTDNRTGSNGSYHNPSICGTQHGSGVSGDFILSLKNGKIGFYQELSGSGSYIDTLVTVSDNIWHNIVLTKNDSGVIKMYKNSVEIYSGSGFTSVFRYSDLLQYNWELGRTYWRGEDAQMLRYNGSISYHLLYNRALSQEEITHNYNVTKDRFNTIVYNGLVLNLDASNSLSYDGTTIWRDLSGNNNHGTLVNGVGYTSSNSGSLVFDGTNDKVTFGNGVISNTNGITVSVWFNTSSASKYQDIFDLDDSQGVWIVTSSGQIQAGFNTNSNYMIYNYSPNTWYNVILSGINNSNNLYVNGVLRGTQTQTVKNNMVLTNARIGNVDGDRSSEYFIGMIPSVQIYNRVLSQDEITQNYNATKSRFGL